MNIKTFGTIKLNSFRPLCGTELGLNAIKKYKFPPFIDASCRREPDFENPFPSISALCRQGQFAPHLRKDDIVVYITVGGQFAPYKKGHHLVAILQVEEVYATHIIGEREYLKALLPLPSNCMVTGNPPYDFDKTGGNFKTKLQLETFLSHTPKVQQTIGRRIVTSWDSSYFTKSTIWKCFVKTKIIYLDINNPTHILPEEFDYIFGKLPNTRTPKKLTDKQFIELGKLAGLDIKLG